MRPLPKAFDLASIIAAAKGKSDLQKKLQALARATQRAQSCLADLRLARTTMEALAQLDGARSLTVTPVHLTTIQHGLVANALVLYARATSTHSDGGERGSVAINDRLGSDDLREHTILITLRNRVIAHVHSEDLIDASIWHRERLIMTEDDAGNLLPGCLTARIQVHEPTVSSLRRMIPVAIALVEATFHKYMRKLTEEINRVGIYVGDLDNHAFDAVGFLGSYEAALDALTPRPGGSALGIIQRGPR